MYLQSFSISQLLEAKATASKVTEQFPLRPAKVKQIVASIKKHNQFLSTFSLAEFDGTIYLVGGRHRLQALLSIVKDNEDGLVLEATTDDAVFPGVVQEVESLADVVLLTQMDNDSRAMPPAERQYLSYTFDYQLEDTDYIVNNVSRLRTAYLFLNIKHPSLNTNTVRQIWSAVIGSLSTKQKKVLTSNPEALVAFGKDFERLLVPAAKQTTTPARNYKKVADAVVLAGLFGVIDNFEVPSKKQLTKQDKEDVAILGKALERSLKAGDKIAQARGYEPIIFDKEAAAKELSFNPEF